MQRIYVVSGGGTGIGRAIARSLAVQGDQVVIVGRRAAVLDATAREIDDATVPGRVRPYALDGTDPEAVAAFADALGDEHEVIDGVINNAGGSTAPRGDLSGVAAAWRQTFEENVMTAVLLTTALAPLLRRPGGRVVLVSSMATRSGGGGPLCGRQVRPQRVGIGLEQRPGSAWRHRQRRPPGVHARHRAVR
ncbi:SDR family oxidoreductase [Acidiferrimicrobium sp. IK]|uniref:SDR family NAD(P)-dependent oxidoreductase n=1 Tax=Acidiferrimicrobium sp. IK TaxID=2871700 RepID=UPI0021CB736F|nr:SDR family oxidoreductase [Acidiferrimicrobium sp. IK]MCU4186797.1 SDR family oxidoreductase [Acidiferrimicrobium sp. IK]